MLNGANVHRNYSKLTDWQTGLVWFVSKRNFMKLRYRKWLKSFSWYSQICVIWFHSKRFVLALSKHCRILMATRGRSNIYCSEVTFNTNYRTDKNYSASQEVCIRFAFFRVLCWLCWFGNGRCYPYLSRLLHWHLGNLTSDLVPVKWWWIIWANGTHESTTHWWYNQNKTKHNDAYFIGNTIRVKTPVKAFSSLINYKVIIDGWRQSAATRNTPMSPV